MPKEVPPRAQAEEEPLQQAVQEVSEAAEVEAAQPEKSKSEQFQEVVAGEIDEHEGKLDEHTEQLEAQQKLINGLKELVEKQNKTLEEQSAKIDFLTEKANEEKRDENRELKHYDGDYFRRPDESDSEWQNRVREQALEDSGGNEKYADQMVQWHTQEQFERTGLARNAREKIAETYSAHEQAEKDLQEQLDSGKITQLEYDQQKDKLETEALQKVDLVERAKERTRDQYESKRYADEDSSAFYDEANTIASDEDKAAYERWQQQQDEEYASLSEDAKNDFGNKVKNPEDFNGVVLDESEPGSGEPEPEPEGTEFVPGNDPEAGEGDDVEDEEEPDTPKDIKLVASQTIREQEAKIHAEQLAEEALNKDLETMKGPFKAFRKAWKGTAFRSFYRLKYREMAEARLKQEGGAGLNENELRKLEKARDSRMGKILSQTMETMEFGDGGMTNVRLARGATGEAAMVREKVGEKAELADNELGNMAREIMEDYVSGNLMEKYRNGELGLPEGLGETEVLDRSFDKLRAAMQAGEGYGEGDALAVDNFVEIAQKAREMSEKLEGDIEDFSERMDKVFDGFQLVSAESRGVTRSEVHRSNIDKIVNWAEESRIGRYLPPSVVAAISGAGIYLGQRVLTRSASVVAPLVGGAAVGGMFAGAREGERVARDRATMGVAMERGLETGDTRADRQIRATEYEMRSVNSLVENMRAAKEAFAESGSDEDKIAWMNAAKEAAFLQDYADENGVGLLAYDSSSEKSLAQQQTEFLGEISEVMRTLSPEEQENFLKATEAEDDVIHQVKEGLEKDISEKDDLYKKTRRKRMVATGAKTFAIAATAGVVIQEVSALVNPNQVGALERLGIGRENNSGARDTSLARLLGMRNERLIGDKIPENELARLRGGDRLKITENPRTYHEEETTITRRLGGSDRSPDHWANNGTNYSDGNEVRLESGYARLRGTSYDPGTGSTINPDNNKVEFLVRAGGRSEILDAVKNSNGNWVPEDPSKLAQFYDNQGRFTGEMLHVGVSNENGWTSLATDIGTGVHDGTITETITERIADPLTYTVTETAEVASAIPIGEAGRRNLSGVRRAEAQPEPETPETSESPETPENEPSVPEAEPETPEGEPESEPVIETGAEPENGTPEAPGVVSGPVPEGVTGETGTGLPPDMIDETEEGEDLDALEEQFTEAIGSGSSALARRGVEVSLGENPNAFRSFWTMLNDEQRSRVRAILPDNAKQRFQTIVNS